MAAIAMAADFGPAGIKSGDLIQAGTGLASACEPAHSPVATSADCATACAQSEAAGGRSRAEAR